MSEKAMLGTTTGEYYQPVRLHYKVFDRKGVLKSFEKLQCVQLDPNRLRWLWLYDHEARDLPFTVSHTQIPSNLQPVVIGYFLPRSEDRLVFDVRSHERACLAIPFFDEHIPRKQMMVTEAEIVNRLFGTEEAQITPEKLFDQQEAALRDPEAKLRKIAELTDPVADPEEKLRIVWEHMEAMSNDPAPTIERLPIHYYEEGIGSFTTCLRLRQIVAYQHWKGNTEYSLSDVIKEMMKRMP